MDRAAPDGVGRRPSIRQGPGWLTLALLAAFSTPMAQQRERRVEPAAVPVRCTEGTVHGFLELRTATGALLAQGDLLQVARDRGVESRLVFHFSDASVFEEAVTFTQHGVFTMQSYHLVQGGPAFANDLEVTLSRPGQFVVKTKSHRDGDEKQYTGKLDLPPDVYNGMVITIAKNLVARHPDRSHRSLHTQAASHRAGDRTRQLAAGDARPARGNGGPFETQTQAGRLAQGARDAAGQGAAGQ